MINILLAACIVALGVFGFKRIQLLDDYIHKNKIAHKALNAKFRTTVRIGIVSYHLLEEVKPALDYSAEMHPHIALRFIKGSEGTLLKKLKKGSIDLVLLEGEAGTVSGPELSSSFIPNTGKENEKASPQIMICKNKNLESKERDSIIFALENSSFALTKGYCDYLS